MSSYIQQNPRKTGGAILALCICGVVFVIVAVVFIIRASNNKDSTSSGSTAPSSTSPVPSPRPSPSTSSTSPGSTRASTSTSSGTGAPSTSSGSGAQGSNLGPSPAACPLTVSYGQWRDRYISGTSYNLHDIVFNLDGTSGNLIFYTSLIPNNNSPLTSSNWSSCTDIDSSNMSYLLSLTLPQLATFFKSCATIFNSMSSSAQTNFYNTFSYGMSFTTALNANSITDIQAYLSSNYPNNII